LTSAGVRPVEKWADVGVLRMRYLDWGGSGSPVVALHGLASSARWYDLVAPHLSQLHRVVAPDQRGHGQTTQAGTGYDWQTLASDIAGLMDHLSIEQAAVLGHSWGANVALNLAARFPHRVTSLVTIDGGLSSLRVESTSDWEQYRAARRPRDVSGTRQQFLDRLRVQLAFCWNNELERIVQTMIYEDGDGQVRDILWPENHVQVMRAMWEEPTSIVWPRVQCRTLIVPAGPLPHRVGTEAARVKEGRVAAAVRGIKNCRVHWIPETVHDIGYHKPQELASAVLEFLAEDSADLPRVP
jgi:pimeloyl-ACP methyl ester carboxylesterase